MIVATIECSYEAPIIESLLELREKHGLGYHSINVEDSTLDVSGAIGEILSASETLDAAHDKEGRSADKDEVIEVLEDEIFSARRKLSAALEALGYIED